MSFYTFKYTNISRELSMIGEYLLVLNHLQEGDTSTNVHCHKISGDHNSHVINVA